MQMEQALHLKEDSAAREKCKSASTAVSLESRWGMGWMVSQERVGLFKFKTDNFSGAGNAAAATSVLLAGGGGGWV